MGSPGLTCSKKATSSRSIAERSSRGYHGDAAVTVAVGDVPALTEKLLRVTEESLVAGLGPSSWRATASAHDVGLAVQTVAEGAGFSVVRGYVGHAIGTEMHEEPAVPNYWPGNPGSSCVRAWFSRLSPWSTSAPPKPYCWMTVGPSSLRTGACRRTSEATRSRSPTTARRSSRSRPDQLGQTAAAGAGTRPPRMDGMALGALSYNPVPAGH